MNHWARRIQAGALVLAGGFGGILATEAQAELPDLLAYWSFDDSNDLYRDDSGNGFHGTAGAGSPSQGAGRVGGGSLSVGGADDMVVSDELLSTETQFSVTAWARFDGTPQNGDVHAIVSKFASNQHGMLLRGIGTDSDDIRLSGATYDPNFGSTPDYFFGGDYDSWHHVAFTYDDGGDADPTTGTGTIYIDGVEAVSGDLGFIPNPEGSVPFTVGGRNSNTWFWEGLIDEVSVWDGPLNADHVAILADGQTTPLTIPEPASAGLVGLSALMLLGRRRR